MLRNIEDLITLAPSNRSYIDEPTVLSIDPS
jgi:hypothetical protein